ncbi:MAG: TIGR03545 family protein [Rubripirellula sp.]
MIRWRFVLTRLIVIIAVIALLRWGLGPVASYVTVRGLESATGAKVEIAKARVGLFPPRVQYSGFRVADPRDDKEMRDALKAATIELELDGDALLHRRWIAREGKITGLEIGTKRDTSGHITRIADPAPKSEGPSVLSQLIGAGAGKVSAQADAVIDGLETVHRSKQIRADWEREYESLVTRARELEKKIRSVVDRAKVIDNPLRDLPAFERTLAEASEARDELFAVQKEINALPARLQADLAKLEEAKQIDIAKIDQFVPGDLSDTKNFGVDIMAEAVREQIQQVRGYLDGGKTLANYTVVAPKNNRIRGVDHDLERTKRPSIMVRHCEVGGLMRADGNVYALTGIVENMTPSPELLAEPTRARFKLEGPEVLRVEYVRDRRANNDVDLLTLHWPEMDAKSIRMGDADEAAIAINGGQRELWVQIRSEGDDVQGRLVSKQTGVQMGVSVDPKFADTAAVKSLQSSLAAVDRIEIDANFSGTWKDLDLKLNTNLGQILHRATEDAVQGQIRESKAMLAAKIDQAHSKQTLELQQWLSKHQGEALSLLANASKSIDQMSGKLLDESGKADAVLGRLRSVIRGKMR